MIRFQNITAGYTDGECENLIFENFSLEIASGEFVTIMGPNGSGKSTLARLAIGLLPLRDGEIFVNEFRFTPDFFGEIQQIRRCLGLVFQNPEHQIIATSVEREIAFGLENIGLPREEMHRRVARMLLRFRLSAYRQQSPNLLSGGEKQRLAVASVMAMQPEHLIFDEPTSLLDPETRIELLNLMRDLNAGKDDAKPLTIINITQFPEEALLSSRIIILEQGKILLDGPPREIFQKIDILERIGIYPPLEFYVFRELVSRYGHVISIEDLIIPPIS